MFDPYYKWLGILPKDQPPNHYRLLGVEIFEGDADVIEGAVDRQMAHIRQYQSGEHASAAAKILNELASARLCLLKPASKSAYDAKLRESLAPPEPKIPEKPIPREELTDDSQLKPIARKSSSRKKPKKGDIPQSTIIAGGIVSVLLLVIVVLMNRGSRSPAPIQRTTTNDNPSDATKVADTAVVATPSIAGSPNIPQAPPQPTPVPRQSSNILAAWTDVKLMTDPAGDPIDLLKGIDLKRDALVGEWGLGATLAGPQHGRLYLPITPPDDYQLRFSGRRLEGDSALVIGFVMAGRQGMISLDGWGSTASGLYVDNREARNNRTTKPGKLFTNQNSSSVVLTVHPGHLHVVVDEKTIIDWHGNPIRLEIDPWYKMPSREQPFLALLNSKFDIESATLTPLKQQAVPDRIERLNEVVSVVPMMDIDRDRVIGDWSIDKNDVLRSSSGHGQVYLPTVVPKEYTLSVTAELPASTTGFFVFSIGLIAGDSYFQFTTTQESSGIDQIDGNRWDKSETRLNYALLKHGTPMRFDCTVTASGIRVEGNGKPLVDWRGDIRRFTIPDDWALADARRLYVASLNSMIIRDIKLGPPIDESKLPEYSMSVGKSLDLMPLIDPERDAYEGTWKREGTSLLCQGNGISNKLSIPVEVPDEYLLKMTVTRLSGAEYSNEALVVGTPSGDSRAYFSIDGGGSTVSGIHDLESDKAKTKGTVIPPNATKDLVFTVRKTGLKLSCDGATILDWAGNPSEFPKNIYFSVPGRRILIGSWKQRFRFEKLELEPLPPGNISRPVLPLGADGNLLSIIDPVRDSRLGDWNIEKGGLTAPTITNKFQSARIRIPCPVPEKYVLSATVERKEGEYDLWIGLVVGGNQCSIAIDGEQGNGAGIELLDGVTFYHALNPAHRHYKGMLLRKGTRVKVRCAVTPDSIIASVGDKEVIRWHGDPRRLTPRIEFAPPNMTEADRTSLWLGYFLSSFIVRDLVLKPMSDEEAEQISKSFSSVFPTTSQRDVPLASQVSKSGARSR